MPSESPPSLRIRLLWWVNCIFWGTLVLGIAVNMVYDVLKQADILLWIRQNLLIAAALALLVCAETAIIGIIRYKEKPPAHSIIGWIVRRFSSQPEPIASEFLPYGIVTLIAIGSFVLSQFSREIAVAIIPFAVVALLLSLILLVTEICSLVPEISSHKPYLRRVIFCLSAALIVAASLIYHYVQFVQIIPVHQTEITIAYSTEKQGWLQDAIDRYNQQQWNIRVKAVDVRGSLEQVDNIVNGSLKPTIFSPASTVELELLYTRWNKQWPGKGEIFSQAAKKSLVSSPLVLATWKSREGVLRQSNQPYWPLDWQKINDLLSKNWSEIGGPSEWGKVKFSQTEPVKSNSGLQTIMHMAHSYPVEQQDGLTFDNLNNPQFQDFFQTIENRAGCYAPSTHPLVDSALQYGPSVFDIFPTYENEFLSQKSTYWTYQGGAKGQQNDSLVVSYPNLSIISDHPFVTLQGDWVKSEQENAAKDFLAFLLGKEQQERALTFGFRPSNTQVLLNADIPDNRFLKYPDSLNQNLARQVQVTDGKVVEELINRWKGLGIEKWCPS